MDKDFGYSPQRVYKRTTDLNTWQLLGIGLPLLLMFTSFSASKINKVMLLPSIILILIFVVLCLLPSQHNHGKRWIVSVILVIVYTLRRMTERILRYV